jgi:hypothetical protein
VRSKSSLRIVTGRFVTSVRLPIRIKQLDYHGANFRQITHLRFKPNWSTNFDFGQTPTKIADNSQKRIFTYTRLVVTIDTVFSVRHELRTNKQLKK